MKSLRAATTAALVLGLCVSAACSSGGETAANATSDAANSPDGTETRDWTRSFELADGSTETAGQSKGCGERWRDAGERDADDGLGSAIPSDWEELYVDASAGNDGDGTRSNPYDTLADALPEPDDPPVEIVLAPGTYRRPEDASISSSIAIRGSCAAETILEGPADQPVLPLRQLDRVVVGHLWIRGGTSGLRAENVAHFHGEQLRIQGAENGVWFEGVDRAEIDHSTLADAEGPGVVALDSAVRLRQTFLGPGGSGVVGQAPVTCGDDESADTCR